MGIFDKAMGMAQQAQDGAAQAIEGKLAERDARKELERSFKATKKMGDLEIDSRSGLLKIRHASAEIPKKKSAIGTATVAMMTGGLSLAASAAMRPRDVIVPLDMVRGYSVIQDDDSIQGGTLGAAAIGGALLGGVGLIAGAVGGKRKVKKVVNLLALRVDLADIDMPCAVVPYITGPTKTGSNDYKKAVSRVEEACSMLDLILSSR